MARTARLVIPRHPHHVIQRGVRGMPVFLGTRDYRTYRALLGEWCAKAGTDVVAYCLMPNHVHLILVPKTADGLRAALGETHRRYARYVNQREGWLGHLWQERFHSFVMDHDQLVDCARYVERNPLRARLVRRARNWRWSSARAHLEGEDDGITHAAPLLERAPDWSSLLEDELDEATLQTIRRHVRTGHPLGSDKFYKKLERRLGRSVRPRPPGRPKRSPERASRP